MVRVMPLLTASSTPTRFAPVAQRPPSNRNVEKCWRRVTGGEQKLKAQNEIVNPEAGIRHGLKNGRKLLQQKALWLGGRDSNPDTVVQRSVWGFWSASLRYGLLRFSRPPLRFASLRFDVVPCNLSLCVSPYRPAERPRARRPRSPNVQAVTRTLSCKNSGAKSAPLGQVRV